MAADSKFQASPDQASYQHLPVTHYIKRRKEKKKGETGIRGGREGDDTFHC